MTSLYEQYKDALRHGHVAAMRGRFDEALAAYRLAAQFAPDRPLPHVSQGNVLVRAGHTEEALVAYAEGLRRAPRDEGALSGQADILARAGRRVEAADALDLLASVQEAAGRTAEACDTARRALEQAESKARRRHVEELTQVLRQTPGDRAAEQALTRALLTLEGPAPALERPADASATTEIAPSEVEPEVPPEPEPEPEIDIDAVTTEADEALGAGDLETARERLLSVAVAHGRQGRHAAALDACFQALAIAPSHPDVHLALVDLYVARGWRAPAVDKLVLLSRLVDLDADVAARERLCGVVGRYFPAEPRLTAICA